MIQTVFFFPISGEYLSAVSEYYERIISIQLYTSSMDHGINILGFQNRNQRIQYSLRRNKCGTLFQLFQCTCLFQPYRFNA